MRELTTDDIKYISDNGTVIYLDNVNGFNNETMFYNGEEYQVAPEKLQEIKDKKDKYELLKLNTSRNNLKDLIQQETKEILESEFTKIINSKLSEYDNFIISLNEKSQNIDSLLYKYKINIENNISKQETINENLKKLEETNIVKEIEYIKYELNKAKNEFKSVTSKLKELFE